MDTPIENYVEADAPIENNVEAELPIENNVEPELPIKNNVEAELPIENNVEAELPIENNVEADVSVAVDAADVTDMQDMAEKADMTGKADMVNMTDIAYMNEATENLNDQKRERDDDVTAGVGEKRWPGWPGESVFRILVPSQKVGGIIGRKGESIKRMCEESRARIKILDGPQGAPERTVLFADLDNIQIFVLNQNRGTKIQFAKSSL